MLPGIKTLNSARVNEIHEQILNLTTDLTFRVFPIYVRYLKGDELFALLYFNYKDHVKLGIAHLPRLSDRFEDASWMKYKEIQYGITITNEDDLSDLFTQIKAAI